MDLLAQMATFDRVVRAGSLSGAARGLGISVAAVSRQVARLERTVGAPLLLRSTRGLGVTDAGRRYHEHCVRILDGVDEANRSVRAEPRVEGRLVVSAPVTLGHARIAPQIPDLLRAHPALAVDLRLEDRLADLVAEGVDVAIRSGVAPPASGAVIARPLFESRRLLVANAAYLRRRGEPATPAALPAHDALVHLGASGTPGTWRLRRGGKTTTVPVRGALRTNAVAVLADAARAGLGIALVPDWLVEDDLATGRLRRILPAYEGEPAAVSALYRHELRGAPRVRAFVEHLTSSLAVTPRSARP